ncbi:hypothetical protein JCM3770_002286 [Rhodotorula araucariae]
MRRRNAVIPLALAGYASAAAVSSRLSCGDLWNEAPKRLENLEVYIAEDYPEGTNLTTKWATVAYPDPVPDLPAFCRFGGFIHTSNISKVQFDVWLSTVDEWSGRFAMVGNGGDAGGVNSPDMWGPIKNYGFAVASTDTGHHGVSGNGTFAINNPESQKDFGYRVVHLTTVYSKEIVKSYYGKSAEKNYWFGCSSGGKQGVKEAQMYPEDYDGILAGAAAQFRTRLSAQIWRANAIINPATKPDYLSRADFDTIGAAVLNQCDELDGLKDGIITNPLVCQPDLNLLSCDAAGANTTSCLSAGKIAKIYLLYSSWFSQANGSFIFFNYLPGSEAPSFITWIFLIALPGFYSPDYFQYQVLNATEVSNFTVTDEVEFEKLVTAGLETNPGGVDAADPYIGDFLKRGKLLSYVGLADTIIPPESSIWYHNQVQKALGYPVNFDDSYRLFAIPGMGHCSSGPGAWNFGGPGQRQASLRGSATSATFDREHDAILALIDWVENGVAPEMIIGAKYTGDNKANGVAFTRPHCVYPKQAVYKTGDPNKASSFICANVLGNSLIPA